MCHCDDAKLAKRCTTRHAWAVDWPTWKQGALAALVSGLIALVTTRTSPRRHTSAVVAACKEFSLVASLYAVWRIARTLPLAHDEGAIDRGRQINNLQQWLHFPTELSLQTFVLGHDWLARLTNYYYAIVHVPALVAFLVWIYVRHRDLYPRWRNGLVAVTGFCLVIRFIRVAPPRFLPDLGYVDLSSLYGMSVYGPVGTGVSDQFAAMPSIHVGWAAVVSLGTFAATTSRWRWVVAAHVVITMIVVSASGNHWWLDGLVAIGLLLIGLGLDTRIRRALRSRHNTSELDDEREVSLSPLVHNQT
jgi:PAP2 superfamily